VDSKPSLSSGGGELWNRADDTSGVRSEQLSALLSLVAAAVIVGATYFQWWDVTYDGGLSLRRWVKYLLALLVAAGVLLVVDPF
jgi:hypothetical protein